MKNNKKINDDNRARNERYDESGSNISQTTSTVSSGKLKSPNVREESIIMLKTDIEEDDEAVVITQATGEHLDEDLESPRPVDVVGDIDKAEGKKTET